MSIDRWKDKEDVVYVYTREYYSAIKKNEMLPFATTWMDLGIIILSEVKSDRERQISYNITYMWSLKRKYKWIYLQNRNRLTDIENKLTVTKGERKGGGIKIIRRVDLLTYTHCYI